MVQTTKWVLAWLVFTAVAVIGGEVYDLYEELYWYDLMLHTASGFMLLLMYDTYSPIKTQLH